MKKVIITSLLVITTLINGCFYDKKPTYTKQPFVNFITYPVPPRVSISGTGDCVPLEDVKKIVIRNRRLERIINNYEMDISDYKALKGEEK